MLFKSKLNANGSYLTKIIRWRKDRPLNSNETVLVANGWLSPGDGNPASLYESTCQHADQHGTIKKLRHVMYSNRTAAGLAIGISCAPEHSRKCGRATDRAASRHGMPVEALLANQR
ncbi:hypothetical protein ACTXT7_008661 [Hymenolepis weldensis]